MDRSDYLGFLNTRFAETLAFLRSPENIHTQLAASIIIVNYNGWQDLERCLRSLEASQSQDCEVIVVDNCSTDDSPEKIKSTFPHVRLIRSNINLGFGAGNNLGAQIAQGRVLVFLNPDTTVQPGWLDPLLRALDEYPQAGMVTSRILLMDTPDQINTCGNDLHLSGLALCRGMGQCKDVDQPIDHNDEKLPVKVVRVAAISGAAFAIRKELYESVGGFDDTFFLYMEDTDLSVRVQLAGYHCLYVPGSVVYHDYQLSFGPMKTYYQERNRYLMLLKNLRWPTLLILLPALILSEVVTWGFVLLQDRKRFRNKLFAYAWILFWWKEIMEKRAATQKLRRVSDRSLLRMTTPYLDFAQASGSGLISQLAHLVFDPLFAILRWAALALVWW